MNYYARALSRDVFRRFRWYRKRKGDRWEKWWYEPPAHLAHLSSGFSFWVNVDPKMPDHQVGDVMGHDVLLEVEDYRSPSIPELTHVPERRDVKED